MIVFLFRPSPQVPRPSIRAAVQCYEASEFNIYLQKKQIETKSIDITWIFAQTLFMAINCLLWTLSYSEIRQMHSRDDVSKCLAVGLEAIEHASERWPGVLSAIELYQHLIEACLKIYDKDGDIPIAVGSPSESTSGTSNQDQFSRSRTTSPATMSSTSITTPEKANAPFGYINYTQPFQLTPEKNVSSTTVESDSAEIDPLSNSTSSLPQSEPGSTPGSQQYSSPQSNFSYDPNSQFNPLPDTFSEIANWNPMSHTSPQSRAANAYGFPDPGAPGSLNPAHLSQDTYPLSEQFLYQADWGVQRGSLGLDRAQQNELMRNLESSGTGQIENMIEQSNAIFGYHTTQ